MSTWWNSQQGEGEYSLQFETDNREKFRLVEKAAQMAIDGKTVDDVAEVKHGEWKEHFAYGCWHYDCPFCDDGFATKERQINTPNYCQNCGAKMRGGKEE